MGILEGKTAFVTGARKGIGRAVVEAFAREGANVWACARKEDPLFSRDMADIALRFGVDVRPLAFDMRDGGAMLSAVKEVRTSGYPLDIVVPMAGSVAKSTSFLMTPAATMHDLYEINLVSQMKLVQYLTRFMRDGSSIVAISSISAETVMPGQYAYACSKGAVETWTRMLAQELGPKGIRVNAVAPGFVDTDMGNEAAGDLLGRILDSTIMRRMARPEEIANVITMLASDYCSYVTGQIIKADGGGGLNVSRNEEQRDR